EPDSPFYNIPAALRLSGPLDAAALERALGELVRRHESLRTTFTEVDGVAAQVIAPFSGFHLPVDDLSDGSAEVREYGSALDPRETGRTPALPHSRTL